jgi:two-component sensor histidine kinase
MVAFPKQPQDIMLKQFVNPHRLLGLMRWGFILVPLIILLIGGTSAWFEERARAVEAARVNAELVRQYALRVIEAQSVVLDQVGRTFAGVDLLAVDQDEIRERLLNLERDFNFAVSLGISAADGRLFTSSRSSPFGENIGDQGYFSALRDGDQAPVIDRTVLHALGRDAVIVAKRRPGEVFAGIIVSAVDVDAFTSFFGEITSTQGASASLLRSDGKLLLRHFPQAQAIHLEPDAPAMRAIAAGDFGTYEALAVSDNIRRIYAFRKLRQLPVFAHYGVAVETIWRTWATRLMPGVILLLIASLLGYLAARETMRRMLADEEAAQVRFDRALLDEAERTAAFKDMLLRELHHRVKNNLLQVQSLLRMRNVRSGAAPGVLEEIENRVWAMGQVHELLHESEKLSAVDLDDLVGAICRNPSIVPPERNVTLRYHCEPLVVDVELASPIALILVELLTNAVKHAFPHAEGGAITVSIRQEGQTGMLEVADDGVGLAEGDASRRSGLRLVDGLVQQIGGTLEVAAGGGARFIVCFPLSQDRAATDPRLAT